MALCPRVFLFVVLLALNVRPQALKLFMSQTLTPSTSSENDARILVQSSSEVSGSDVWAIDVSEQDTWHLKAELGSSWGFHPSSTSAISITIDSPTTPGPTFDDVLIAFTVPNSNEFTAVRLYMDNAGSVIEPDVVARITPQCDAASTPSQQPRDGDLGSILSGFFNRKCALGLSTFNCDSGDGHSGMQPSGQHNSWPITFTLVNVPNVSAHIMYEGDIVQSCGFTNGFTADQGLDVYFALGRVGDAVEISSFQFTYSLNTTLHPTTVPTPFPTNGPTVKPTVEPTPRSGEIDDVTTTSTEDHIGEISPVSDGPVDSLWIQWVGGPYFIPSLAALGCLVCTLCTAMLYCCLKKKRGRRTLTEMHRPVVSNTSILGGSPKHSVRSTMSTVSDARSIMSAYSVPMRTATLTHSAHSTSGHIMFEAPMLFTTNSGIGAPLTDINEQSNGSGFHHVRQVTSGGDEIGICGGDGNDSNLAPTLWTMANASSVDISADHQMDGEEDHDEELYATQHVQLQTRQSTDGHPAHQDTAGALPASFRKDGDLGAALPESLPKNPANDMTETPQGSAEPLMPHKVCAQCTRQTEEQNGRMDGDDEEWYCNECWSTFCE